MIEMESSFVFWLLVISYDEKLLSFENMWLFPTWYH